VADNNAEQEGQDQDHIADGAGHEDENQAPPQPNPVVEQQQQEDHKLNAVKRALGTHAILALLDLVLVPSTFLIPDAPLRHFASMNLVLFLAYWVPVIVVWRNFKNMGGMLKYYLDLIFCAPY
jgi:hypothetical protein